MVIDLTSRINKNFTDIQLYIESVSFNLSTCSYWDSLIPRPLPVFNVTHRKTGWVNQSHHIPTCNTCALIIGKHSFE